MRAAWLFPLGLFLLTVLSRVATLALWPFDGLYGQDPYFYDRFARDLWSAIARGGPLPRSAWPAGYPLMVALSLPLARFADTAGQWVSVVAAALVVALVYLLAHDLMVLKGRSEKSSRSTAIIAGLLTAVSGQLWQSSVVVMSDGPALCWATLSAWALTRYSCQARKGWLLGASFALGWAVMTRWEYGLLVVPFAGYLALQGRDRGRLCHLMLAVLGGLIVLTPQLVLLSGRPGGLGAAPGDSWSIRNAFRREFVTGAGFDRYALPTALFYARPVVAPGYLFPLFAPALLFGTVHMLRRHWWDIAALLCGWAGATYVLLSGLPFQSLRYALVYLPPVMILTAIGADRIVWRAPERWGWVVHGAIMMGFVGMAGWGIRHTGELIKGWKGDKDVVHWASRQLPAGTTLLSHGLTLIAQHETAYDVFDLYELTFDDLAQLTSDARPDYVLLDPRFVEAQWAGRAPAENYHWLQDEPGLEKVDQRGRFVLFRVGLRRSDGIGGG